MPRSRASICGTRLQVFNIQRPKWLHPATLRGERYRELGVGTSVRFLATTAIPTHLNPVLVGIGKKTSGPLIR